MKVGKGQHQNLDRALKKVKYLRALNDLDYAPSEAYVLHHLPVIPPVMRPVSTLPDGSLKFADLNQLYSDFAKINDKLKDPLLQKNLTDAGKADLRRDYYDGVRRLMGVGFPYDDVKHKGILHQIAGGVPKDGFFQNVMVERRQDLTMRSTIVPEPALGLDEVGIPRNAALDLFRPFVIHELKSMGAIKNPGFGEYGPLLAKKPPVVWKALERVMADRPVLMKRDPALHKYSVQAFKARPVVGNAVQIHPLVTSGYNADFDGDTMSIYVPITREAIQEAHKMFPSNNLFSDATGKVMYQPTLESALGLYKLSLKGKDTNKKFFHPGEVTDAAKKGEIKITDVVQLGKNKTTAGRVLLASAVPEKMQNDILHKLDNHLDRDGLDSMLTTLARDHSADYGTSINKLKDLGNGMAFGAVALPKPISAGHNFSFRKLGDTPVATHDLSKQVFIPVGTHTLSLDDFTPDTRVRDAVLHDVTPKVQKIYDDKKLSRAEQDRQAIDLYTKASEQMKKLHTAAADSHEADGKTSNLYTMLKAGVKPGWDQYKQMILAPMLLKDSADRTIPTPVTRSYAEGLDVGGYWTQMHGARRGSVMKVQEVRDPGYLSKQMVASMMHMTVNNHDCGTTRGVSLDISEPDLIGRYMQQDFTHGHMKIPSGTLITPDILGKMKAAKAAQIVVRSPLKCEDEKGLCQKCTGLNSTGQHFQLGTNVGIQSAQAIGERAMQLTLKSFHTGGVQEIGGSKLLSSFNRLQQLYTLPENVPNAAALAMKSGKIEKIEPTATGVDVVIDGHRHHVGKDSSGMPLHEDLPRARMSPDYVTWKPPQVGMSIRAGEPLSDPNRTVLNLHDLFKATGSIEQVQNQMTNEIAGLYKKEGIKRRVIETTVKAMSNLSEITDPGDHPTVLRGEYRPTSVIFKMNEELQKEGKKPIDHKPVLKGVSILPLEIHDDWMAKLQHNHLRDTLLEAASESGVSHLHGTHPIPGVAFGAEFGLTSADSLAPGRAHLKNIPSHHY
jgi:DNA-directed RNA polymerase subunit beta'